MSTGLDNDGISGKTPLADPASGRCANCGTALATDQRYCVNCGERRGKPRFGAPAAAGFAAPEPVATDPVPPSPPRSRFSPGTTLVAGVATLLLAMGVGVLIGEQGANNNAKPTADATPVITVNGGGSSGTASTSTTASNTTKHPAKSSKHKSSSSSTGSGTTVVHLTKKVTSQIKTAVNNVVGTGANLASPTTKVGGSCKNGQAGCQNGKFTGGFFGGG